MQLLRYSGLLLRCCYAVAKVLRVVARQLLGYRALVMSLLGYSGMVARLVWMVARVRNKIRLF